MGDRPKILVIDDELGLRKMLKFGLSKHDYEVDVAATGEEGLALAAKKPFDVIVCDMMMPGKNGIDTLVALKEILPNVDVIMATGYATLETAIQAMKQGAFDYIAKPYSVSTLCAIIEKAQEHQRLQKRVSSLEEVNRLKSEFISTMSHELRTPLTCMIGYLDLLLRKIYGEVPEKQAEILRRVSENGWNLLRLINDVLDLSKLSANRVGVLMEDFDLVEMVKEVALISQALVDSKKLSLKIDSPARVHIRTDRTKLKQILLNLLGNAIKFTTLGGVQISVTSMGGQTEISVKDSGIGIAAADIPKLFQEFRQLDGSNTREYSGTGLGLAISKKLAVLLGGSIQVSSQRGVGSTFTIQLPRADESGRTLTVSGDTRRVPSDPTKTILCMDDEPEVLRLLSDSLLHTGYQVVGAQSGTEGLALARAIKPYCITLDIMMPHMDGWAVLQALKADPELKSIPVYIVSIVDNKALAFSLGVQGYLLKPFDREQLLQTLQLHTRKVQQILVVDDDAATQKTLAKLLLKEGFDVHTVGTGEAAVAHMKQLRPDVLFLDFSLPDMTGFDVLEAMDHGGSQASMSVFVMTEKELSREEANLLEKRVTMILKKHAHSLPELLKEAKPVLTTLRKVA